MPSDPRLSELRLSCRTANFSAPSKISPPPPDIKTARVALSATPTFDCTTAKSPTGRILCLDAEGARADWTLTSAYWARRFSLADAERPRFDSEHENWFPTLNRTCRLTANQSNFSPPQRQCVLVSFAKRAESYRSQLRGDAVAESRLPPDQHAAIQEALAARGFLEGKPDGEFGPLTRAAIARFQDQSGSSPSGFLTSQQRASLQQEPPRIAEARAAAVYRETGQLT
jgi:Putative peptidoglycan binding domain